MKNILSAFILTILLSVSANLYAHCGDAEAHAKASDQQLLEETEDKKDKEKNKGWVLKLTKSHYISVMAFFWRILWSLTTCKTYEKN